MTATNASIADYPPQYPYHEAELLQTGPDSEIAVDLGFVQRVFAQLDERERPLVRIVMRGSQHPVVYGFGAALNWLGNGWLYLFAAIALLLWQGATGIRPAIAGALSVGIAHVFYVSVKPILGRLRPRDADPLARLPIEPMDKFSCPSGHCMTFAAVAVPLLICFPQLQLLILSLCGLIAWSRVACGHHYPSDVLLGIGLGIAVSMPMCNLIL